VTLFWPINIGDLFVPDWLMIFIVFSGFLLILGAKSAIAWHAFHADSLTALLILVVPFYLYFYARKHGVCQIPLNAWYLGYAFFILGGVLT